jgi:hypothetical protein
MRRFGCNIPETLAVDPQMWWELEAAIERTTGTVPS